MDMIIPGEYFLDSPDNENVIGNKVDTPNPVIQKPTSAGQKKGNKIVIPIPNTISSELRTKVFSMPILSITRSEKKRDKVIQIIKDKYPAVNNSTLTTSLK